jgi:hypothetical protein
MEFREKYLSVALKIAVAFQSFKNGLRSSTLMTLTTSAEFENSISSYTLL